MPGLETAVSAEAVRESRDQCAVRMEKSSKGTKIRRLGPETIKAFGEVVDLSCGVGALSYGLKRPRLRIVAGYNANP
jgi:hypothetical protein